VVYTNIIIRVMIEQWKEEWEDVKGTQGEASMQKKSAS
jgi:hypothetical protein